MKLSIITCLISLISYVLAYVDDVVDYRNYSVVSTVANSLPQLELLRILYLNDAEYKVDFWNAPSKLGERVWIGLMESQVGRVTSLLTSVGAPIYAENIRVSEVIDEELESNPPQFGRASSSFAFDQYHRFSEISAYMRDLALEKPNLVQRLIPGHTVGNREINAIRIGTSRGNKEKPAILIDAGIHAREWVAPATALYMIDQLVSKYGKDQEITDLVEKFDWYIIPVLNPDGYEYTWTSNRGWRKNRSRPVPFSGCYGVDTNRNFDLGFGGASTSDNPCSDLYRGPNAWSEAEARALKKLTEQLANRIKMALTLHSFGQMWMNPWGYINSRPKHYNEMLAGAKKAVTALKSVHGTDYKVGAIYEVIYPTGGGSSDWQYSLTNIPFVYAVELRPTQSAGMLGFQLHRSLIIPTAEETWKAVTTLAKEIV